MEWHKNALREIIDNHTFTVTHEFLHFLKHKFETSDNYTSLEGVHAEALEHSLALKGLLVRGPKVDGESYQWRHDWLFHSLRIDLKRKPRIYKNVSLNGLHGKMQKSFDMGELTHFVGYSTNVEGLLKYGDELTFKFHRLISFEDAKKEAISVGNYHILKVE